jgi:hypothetical protein
VNPKKDFIEEFTDFVTQSMWPAVGFISHPNRPLEVLYGRLRYCHYLFDQEPTEQLCLENWSCIFSLFNSNTILSITGVHGSFYTLNLIVELDCLKDVGLGIVEIQSLDLDNIQKTQMIREYWLSMQRALKRQMNAEDYELTAGATKYCENLKSGKYHYDDSGILKYPIFSI